MAARFHRVPPPVPLCPYGGCFSCGCGAAAAGQGRGCFSCVANPEFFKLLPRATYHHTQGCDARAAWGRASAEFPELRLGRRLVEVLLIGKSSTSNVERRFNLQRLQRSRDRARLLDVTVEELLLVSQTPPSVVWRRRGLAGARAPVGAICRAWPTSTTPPPQGFAGGRTDNGGTRGSADRQPFG